MCCVCVCVLCMCERDCERKRQRQTSGEREMVILRKGIAVKHTELVHCKPSDGSPQFFREGTQVKCQTGWNEDGDHVTLGNHDEITKILDPFFNFPSVHVARVS